MATQWLRRTWLLAAGASVLLAACGGGEVDSQLSPSRIIVFGDAMADIGQKSATGMRYTVNDGSLNNWTLVVAQSFGVSLAPQRSGGLSYAAGNARVATTPGAGNDPAAPSVTDQISTFLAAPNTFSDRDLVLVNAGTSDVIVHGRAVIEGGDRAQAIAAVGQAGTALGAQVRRLVNAGARHVVVAGPYNLGRSVWAEQAGQETLLQDLSGEFNTKLLLAIQDLGDRVLYVDAALQFNIYEANPGNYDLANVKATACTSTDSADPEEGIGTGPGQVDSSECTPATVVTPAYDKYLFADRVYPTPRGHRLFGEYAVARIRQRW